MERDRTITSGAVAHAACHPAEWHRTCALSKLRACVDARGLPRKEFTMRDMTDPRNIDRTDVGQTNPPSAERKSGVGGFLGVGLRIWSVVILVAIAFLVAGIIFSNM
jgi:hypothetical protein